MSKNWVGQCNPKKKKKEKKLWLKGDVFHAASEYTQFVI